MPFFGGREIQIPYPTENKSMSQYQIAVIVGSLRKDSFNRKLADAIVKLAPPEFSFRQVQIGDLPLYNQDDDEHPAPAVVRMKSGIRAADGILFVSPEYNRSIPGVLKNALDHGSRPPGQSVWGGKPGRDHRGLHRGYRHGHGPAALAKRPLLPGCRGDAPARGLSPDAGGHV